MTPPPPSIAEDAPVRQLAGWQGLLSRGLAIGLSLYALYWVLFVVQPQIYRVSFLLVALVLTFLLVPARRGFGTAAIVLGSAVILRPAIINPRIFVD